MPDDDPLPAPIDIGAQVRDQIALSGGAAAPRRSRSMSDRVADGDELARHDVRECEARDVDVGVGRPGGARSRRAAHAFLLASE